MKHLTFSLADIYSYGENMDSKTYEKALKDFKEKNIGTYLRNDYTNMFTDIKIVDIDLNKGIVICEAPDNSEFIKDIEEKVAGFSLSTDSIKELDYHKVKKINYAALIDRRKDNIKTYIPNKYHIITLCGSTKFKKEFIEVQKQLTLLGNIIISVGCFGHKGDKLTMEDKIMLDDMHKRKILMADEIFVIDKNNYIGSSTKSEIEFAKTNNIPISYYSKDNRINCQEFYSDESTIVPLCKGNNYDKCKDCDIYSDDVLYSNLEDNIDSF